MADAFAPVHVAGKRFVTRQTTGDVLQVAGDVAALLMFSHAPFLSEVGARWTFLLAVAVVKDWMLTLVSPSTQVFALWRLSATGNGWVQHGESTVTRQLIKAGLPTVFTVSTVTRLLAAMDATVKFVAAD